MSTPEWTHLFRCGQPYFGGTRITSVAVASFRDLGFARVDTDREARQGAPEGIVAEGKTPEEIAAIATALLEAGAGSVMVTRADEAARAALLSVAPDAEEDERARLAWVARSVPEVKGLVTIVSGGTSDGPVVREAQVRAELLGTEVVVHRDAGVAGIHRLEPGIARPRARGLRGRRRRLGRGAVLRRRRARRGAGDRRADQHRLRRDVRRRQRAAGDATSCAAGVAVVNIDDGFGAGTIAARIARR